MGENTMNMEQEDVNKIMSEYDRLMAEHDKSIQEHNAPIFESIKHRFGKDFLDDVIEYIADRQTHGAFKIVPKPNGFKQECGIGSIDWEWIDQSTNGPSEDSFAGTCTIKLSDSEYLEMRFEC